MSYWFFFSYAHANDDDYLQKFYKDLAGEVEVLTGAAQSEIGFIDRKNIEHGAEWDAALEKGLQTCRVFVPIYSPSYFLSEYCGKELKIFHERLQANLKPESAARDPLILPVLWNQEDNIKKRLPETIKEIQYTHGDYPKEYLTEGLLQMVRLGMTSNSKFYEQYWDFVRKFAITISDAADKYPLPPLAALTPLDTVESLFSPATRAPAISTAGETGPRHVQFIFVASKRSEMMTKRKQVKFYGQNGGSDWQPYLDEYKGNAAALAIEAVESFSKDLRYEEVVLTDGIVEKIKKAASQGKIIVVVADTWTLKLESYIDLIAPLDAYTSMNCITLILWNEQDEETVIRKPELDIAVKGVFKEKHALSIKNFFPNSIKSTTAFKTELIRALADAQAKIVDTAKVDKIWTELVVEKVAENSDFEKKPSF